MNLVQINAIRELLDDANRRLSALTAPVSPPELARALGAAVTQTNKAHAAVLRLEHVWAQADADAAGAPAA